MKHLFKRVTSLVLALALTLSLCCVASFAADVDYAHFEVGTYEATSLKTGDTVRIPLSIVGMKEGQYCGGFSANITLGDGLEWFKSNNECAEWSEQMSSFGSKFINHSTGLLSGTDFAAASNGETSFSQDGKVCDILCRVTEAYDGTNATIALSAVSISGTTSTVFLNSPDGTKKGVDSGAIIFAGEKVEEGTPISAVIVQELPEYTIVATADQTEVVAGQDVTVTVTVKGGQYVGAAVKLSYDSDKLELKTAADGWDSTGTGYGYYNVNKSGGSFDEDTVIGTFVFTAKAQSTETTTVVALDSSYVAGSFDEGWDNAPANMVSNTDVTVTIKQDELDVTVPAMSPITYDGELHAFEAVTAEGATVTYSETEGGDYTDTIPEKKDAGTYTLYYKAEKLGYSAASDSYQMTIAPRDVTITVPAQGKTYGQEDPDLTYTVNNLVDGETFSAIISRAEGEDVGSYAITVTPGENPNYNVTSNPGGTFTISAATIQGYTVTWNEITSYNGKENSVATLTTAEEATAGVTVTWTVNDGEGVSDIPTIKDAGTYEVTYTISKDGYEPITDTKTFTVAKAAVTITADDTEMTYGGEVPELTKTVTGTIYEGDDLGIQLSTDATSSSAAGTYDITVTYTANDNYEVTANKGTLTVKAGVIEGYVITANDSVDYDEQAHVSATVTTGTPADAAITYTWTEDGEAKTSNEVPSFTEAGAYEVSYTISKENYTDVTGSYTFTINSGVVEASAENVEVDYDGQPHSITVTVTKPQGSTISYRTSEEEEWSIENPTFTNVTETPATVYWKVSKDGYTDQTGSATVTIKPKAVTITVNDKTITLGDALPTFDGSVEGLVNSDNLNVTYACDSYEQKVGEYDITASYIENPNYTVTVNKGTLTVSDPTYVVEVIDEYVAGYHMILVYTNDATTFSYDGEAMYDVTSAGYQYEGTAYSHVYAIVVAGAEGDTDETLKAKAAADMTAVAAVLDCNTLDVNSSNSVDLRDAVAIVAVYNANETYMTSYLPIVLKADVDHSKGVDAEDFGLIKAEYMK